MSYASKIKTKRMKSGGLMLYSAFPAHGQISLTGSLTGGSRVAGSETLAEVHAAMLLEGTRIKSKREIHQLLDDWGASLSFSVTSERLVFQAAVRTAHAKKLCALIAEVLVEPTFPKKEFEHLRTRMRTELSLESQDTGKQAQIAISQLLYEPAHPNYLESTNASLAALEKLTAKDLAAYHAGAISAQSMILAVAGEIEMQEAFALIEKSFARLPQKEILLPSCAPASLAAPQRRAVPIKDKASIDVIYGMTTGIDKNHVEYPALLLGMQVLGSNSGFTGRLMQTVREIDGLTYGTYAFMQRFGAEVDGSLAIWATFAPQLLAQGERALMREITKIVNNGVTPAELKKHAAMYEARVRTGLANSGAFASVAHWNAVDGHTPKYLDEFPKTILGVTKRDVDAALKKYLIPEQLSEALAGPVEHTGE